MLAVGLFQTSHRDRVGFFPLPPSLGPCFAFDNQLICFCFEHGGSRLKRNPLGQFMRETILTYASVKLPGHAAERFTKIPTSLRKKAHFHIFFPSKKCFNCSVIVSTSPAPIFKNFLTPPPSPQHCLQLICIVAQRMGWAVIVVVASAEGVFPPASLSLAESKHLCVAAGDVMALKPLKNLFPGKPHIRKSRQFFFSLSPFLDCYSRAALEENVRFLIRFPYTSARDGQHEPAELLLWGSTALP